MGGSRFPQVRLTCLHTATSNIAVFDRALIDGDLAGDDGATDIELHHVVRADLLAAAEANGGLIPSVRADAATALRQLADECDGVLLTCSTLGPAVDDVDVLVPVLRVDAALAHAAVAAGGTVVVLCAVSTTLGPTADLFARASAGTSATVTVHLVEGAWDLFTAGDLAGYHAAVAQAADDALTSGADLVALAQASMAPAIPSCRRGPVLASPAVGLAAIVRAAERHPGHH
jgi:hypothetical protein